MKVSRACGVVVAAVSLVASLLVAPAQAQSWGDVIDQGDKIMAFENSWSSSYYPCVVTYVDKPAGKVWTSSACGREGSRYVIEGHEMSNLVRVNDESTERNAYGYFSVDPYSSILGRNFAEPTSSNTAPIGEEVSIRGGDEAVVTGEITGADEANFFISDDSLPSNVDVYPGSVVYSGAHLIGGIQRYGGLQRGETVVVSGYIGPIFNPKSIPTTPFSIYYHHMDSEKDRVYLTSDGVNVVNQGETIVAIAEDGTSSLCTVGYIDKPNLRVYTASHCGEDGQEIWATNDVVGDPSKGDALKQVHYLGKLVTDYDEGTDYDDPDMNEDTAYIEIPPERSGLMGENVLSGDERVIPNQLKVGQWVLVYGQTTRTLLLRQIMGVLYNVIVTMGTEHTQEGDSGGPIWLVDEKDKTTSRGFLGVTSGGPMYPQDGEEEPHYAVSPDESSKQPVDFDDSRISYLRLFRPAWEAYRKAEADKASANPQKAVMGGYVGYDWNDYSALLDGYCRVSFVDMAANRIYVAPDDHFVGNFGESCHPRNGDPAFTTSDRPVWSHYPEPFESKYEWWGLQQLGSFVVPESGPTYIHVDNPRLVEGNSVASVETAKLNGKIEIQDFRAERWQERTIFGRHGNKIVVEPKYINENPSVGSPARIGDSIVGMVTDVLTNTDGTTKAIIVTHPTAEPADETGEWVDAVIYAFKKENDRQAPTIDALVDFDAHPIAHGQWFSYTLPITDDYNDVYASIGELPSGLHLDGLTISGYPTELGRTFTDVTAWDEKENYSSPRGLYFRVTDQTAPTIGLREMVVEAGQGESENLNVADNIGVKSVTVKGLPKGFSFDEATNTILGTSAELGTHTFSVSAVDDAGNSSEPQPVTLTVEDTTAPVFTGDTDVTVNEDEQFTIPLRAEDATMLRYEADLPTGMTYDHGELRGKIAEPGTYGLKVTAIDKAGNRAEHTLKLTVRDKTKPTIETGALNLEAGDNANHRITVTDNVGVQNVRVNGLPNGLTFNEVLRVITGATVKLGPVVATIIATDTSGNMAESKLNVTVTDKKPPIITVKPSFTVDEDTDYEIPFEVEDATEVEVTTDKVRGRIETPGEYTATITATDAAGNTTDASVKITVRDVTKPVLPSTLTLEAGADINESLDITDNVGVTAVDVTGLPAGLTQQSNILTGVTRDLGTHTVNITATDAAGNVANGTIALAVMDTIAPVITAPEEVTVGEGEAVSERITATDNMPVTVSLEGTLPTGVTFANDVLSGTPTDRGTFPLSIVAIDTSGNETKQDLTLIVADIVPPVITVADETVTTIDDVSIALDVTDNVGVESVTVNGLPTGLAFEGQSIVGKPKRAGRFTVTVTATDESGNEATATFTLTVEDMTAPHFTGATAFTAEETGTVSIPLTAVDESAVRFEAEKLPEGLILDGDTITGTALRPGTFKIIVTATDDAGNTAKQTITLTIPDNPLASSAVDGQLGSSEEESIAGIVSGVILLLLLVAGGGYVAMNPQVLASVLPR